jgi:hypothetical protein
MSVKNYKVLLVDRAFVKDFIEQYHYSKNINGVISDYCFALFDGNQLIGACLMGRFAMANQYKRFSENIDDVIELRRLVCVDDTPKNTESYFIGHMLRWLNKNTDIKIVVSYADQQYGHSGVIYKASNFKYMGFKRGGKVIEYDGKLYHDKSIRTYYKGVLKPFAVKLIKALETGDANYIETLGKHTYVYEFAKSRKSNKPKSLF